MKDLLFLLADYPFKEANRQVLSELLGKVEEWDRLVRLVNDHGIIALARYNIREAGLDDMVPPEHLGMMENGYLQSVARNLWLAERWKSVNAILNNAGILHILLKGMALEHTVYGAKGLRQMSDCDILIKRDEALKAWNILQEERYKADILKSPLYKKIILDVGKHLPALTKDGFSVEIHTRLSQNRSIDDDLFRNAEEININNTKAYILPRDIHLRYLTDHFNDHLRTGETQIRMFADIRLLDPSGQLEFPTDYIENPSRKMGLKFLKQYYLSTVRNVPPGNRFRYIIGDLFPSIQWMKERHGCGAARTLVYYPRRMGKLMWLI